MKASDYKLEYVEHMTGWKPLVELLVKRLITLNGSVYQVKEKFGGLRFYYSIPETVPDADRRSFDQLLQIMENLSYKTCEVCGAIGALREGSWVKTLCEEHADGKAKCQW